MREGWKKIRLEDALDALIDYRGKTPNKTSSGIPLITAKIVKNGFIQEPDEFIAEEDYDSWMVRGFPKIGDVVLTMEAPLGEVAQIKDERVALAQRIVTLRGKEGLLDNSYLKYFFKSETGQARLKERETGTTVTGIKQSELRLVEIDVPPLSTQHRIAAILSALDEKIELNRQTNQTLEAIAQTLFKEWFVGFNFPGASGKMQESELGPIPVGWKVAPFADTIEIYGGGTPKTSIEEYWDGEIPWFSVADAPREADVWVLNTEKKISLSGVENSSTRLLPQGTTIISARGTVGRIALTGITMAMNQSCYGLRGKHDELGFFTYYTTSALVTELQQRTHGSVFDTITRDTLQGVLALMPPADLIRSFEECVKAVLFLIRENIIESQTLSTTRDALLPKLMNGEIAA